MSDGNIAKGIDSDLLDDYMKQSDYYHHAVQQLKLPLTHFVGKLFNTQKPLVDIMDIQDRKKGLYEVAMKAASDGLSRDELFIEMKDFAGIRLLCFYLWQVKKIKDNLDALVKEELFVYNGPLKDYIFEEVKGDGYKSINVPIIVDIKLPEPTGSITESVRCEIQIRTLLQHAWAESSHDLIYKPSTDFKPSDESKNLFAAESEGLHGHQLSFDRIQELIAMEQRWMQMSEDVNLATLDKFFKGYGETLSNKEIYDFIDEIRLYAKIEKISHLEELLDNTSHQTQIAEVYESLVGNPPDTKNRLLLGTIMRVVKDGRTRIELDVMSSDEFRGKKALAFDFGVIGRTGRVFTDHMQYSGGWFTYHTETFRGSLTGDSNPELQTDGITIQCDPDEELFRVAYPVLALAYPAKEVSAILQYTGNSCFFILGATKTNRPIFFEFRNEPLPEGEKPLKQDEKDGTLYLRTVVEPESDGVVRIESDLASLVVEHLPQEELFLLHGFYFQTDARLFVSEITISIPE